ncbi:MAG: LAGLIDADG family homing endonuclease [Candidatus Diapherotrites archaeon]
MASNALKEDEAETALFKKKIKKLKEFKGRGTELISLYIPPNADRGSVMGQLTEETSQSGNIKSATTRKNVQGALRKIANFLKQINFRIPPKGMVVFAGNISAKEGVSDLRLFTVTPPQELKVKLYWCDSAFHFDPLEEMLKPTEIYGLVVIDKKEATLALLIGKRYEILGKFTSGVFGKFKAGGQCVAEDSLVMLENGRIEEIRNVQLLDRLASVEKESLTEKKGKVVETFSRASRQALRIRTKEPLQEIEVTPEHRFFVAGENGLEERFAEDLKKDETVLLLKNARVQGKKTSNAEQVQAQWLGFVLGDGYSEKYRVRCYESEKETAQAYCALAEQVFPERVHCRWVDAKKYFELSFYGQEKVQALLKEFPEAFLKTPQKHIPVRVQEMDDEGLAAFLRGAYDAEGYVHSGRVSIAGASKRLMQETHLCLLRYGIISSLASKKVRPNPKVLNPKPQWAVEISDFESLKRFQEKIGFSNSRKARTLSKILERSKKFERANQVPISGKFLRKLAYDMELNTESFETLSTNFFRGERLIGFKTFNEKVLPVFSRKAGILQKKGGIFAQKAQRVMNILEAVSRSDLVQARIHSIETISTSKKFYDLAINGEENFIANGFFLHNSAHRFEQLREEAEKEFYKRISEKMAAAWLPLLEKLKGIIVAGPGGTKIEFLEREALDYRLKEKVIGTLDTGYTDESGIREVLQKSGELLKNAEVTKEREILEEFMTQVGKGALAAFGEEDVNQALALGKVRTLLLSEAIEWEVVRLQCQACNNLEDKVVKNPLYYNPSQEKCSKCASSQVEVLEELDYIEWMTEKAHNISAGVRVISVEIEEGDQFYRSFSGIGALLRYK